MNRLQVLLPGGRKLVFLDVALGVWAVVWVVVGLGVAREMQGLSELSDTVSSVGRAVEASGGALRDLDGLPLLGDRVREPAERVEEAGRSAISSGRASRESIDDLSLLLALSVAVIPSLPLLGMYLPLRLALRRERRALARASARARDDPAFLGFLARRAVETIPYRELLKASSAEPWRDLAEGRHSALAAAELERLGVR